MMQRFTILVSTLAAATGGLALARPAEAGTISVFNVLKFVANSGTITYGGPTPGSATKFDNVVESNGDDGLPVAVDDFYFGAPDYPTVVASALANAYYNPALGVVSVVQASARTSNFSTYGTDAFASAHAIGAIGFIVTQRSTATLHLSGSGYTVDPGDGGYNSAQFLGGLYSYNSGEFLYDVRTLAGSDNGRFDVVLPLILEPGAYELQTAALVFGNSPRISEESAPFTLAHLENIRAAVPEPASLAVWSLAGLGSLWCRRCRRFGRRA